MKSSSTIGLVSLLSLLTACKTESSSLSKATEIAPHQNDKDLSLGAAWEADQENWTKNYCIKGTSDEAIISSGSVIKRHIPNDELYESLNLTAGTKSRYRMLTDDKTALFASRFSFDTFSSQIIYSQKLEFKNIIFTPTGTTAFAETLDPESTQWTKECGHEFLQQIVKGAQLLIGTKLEFNSEQTAREFGSKYGSLSANSELSRDWIKIGEEFKDRASILVSILQRGGHDTKLKAFLDASPDFQGKETIRCPVQDFAKCRDALKSAYNYASSRDENSFANQVKNSGQEGGSADLVYITKPYIEAGIFSQDEKLRENFDAQRQAIDDKILRSVHLTNRLEFFMNLGDKNQTKEITDKLSAAIESNKSLISAAVLACYDEVEARTESEKANPCDSAVETLQSSYQDFKTSELEISSTPKVPVE